MESRVRWGAGYAVVAWLASVGCGSAAPKAGKPDSLREPAPTTVGEAQAVLDRDEQRLRRVFPAPPTKSSASENPPPPPLPPATTPPPTTAVHPADNPPRGPAPERPDAAAEEYRSLSPCEEACRALSSMRRAADTICRLTSPEDERCQSARRRVQQGEEQAASCGCARPQG